MGREKRKDIPMWAKTGHRKPVTRREFLAHGLIPFAASALVPNALGLLSGLSPEAAAAEVCASGSSALAAFVSVHLVGGGAIPTNFVPRDKNGDLLPSYSLVGLGSNSANLPLETEFGVSSFAGMSNGALLSPMLAGIRSAADAQTLANTAFIGLCVKTQDDVPSNTLDASGMVFKAGKLGSYLPNLGTAQTVTGTYAAAATVTPPPPLIVGSFNDLANSIGFTAALKTALNTNQKIALTKLVRNLSASQSRKLASINSAAQVQDLISCAGIRNTSLISVGSSAIDPLQNADGADIAAIWGGFTSGTAPSDQDRVFGTMIYNALSGKAGTLNLSLGGYDYHDGTRTTGYEMDRRAGQVIGRTLQSAKAMGKPVFIYVHADGSTGTSNSAGFDAPFTSDRGIAGGAMIFAYHPSGRPATSGFQIGQYLSGQVVDESHVIGSNPEVAAQTVFANYLQFNKAIDLFDGVVGRSPISGTAMNGVLKIV